MPQGVDEVLSLSMGDVTLEWVQAYPWAIRIRRFDDGGLLPELREAFVKTLGPSRGRRAAGWKPPRSQWKPGAWMEEPDLVEWRSAASPYPLLIVRGGVGALCGYVGVPPAHRMHGRSEGTGSRLTEVINWGQPSGGGPVFVTTGDPPHCWWLGFDCGQQQFLPAIHGTDRWAKEGDLPIPVTSYVTISDLRSRVEALAGSLVELAPP